MKPTRIRYGMIALATLTAIMLYLDRVCLSILGEQISQDLKLTEAEYTRLLSVFFWAYALFQLPAGWLGDRYGPRLLLGLYLFLWSACTGLMGLGWDFMSLLVLRLGCGIFEAGAYPLCAGIVRRWVPFTERGMGSGLVAVGGRLGGAIAPVLTVALAAGSVSGWRLPFLWYGGVGMALAVVFWIWFRDRPEEHPAVNAAEVDLIRGGLPPTPTAPVGAPPIASFALDFSLWMMSLVQFLTNFAWVFIITLLPDFLREVYQTPKEVRAWYQAFPLYAGIVGMILGGWLTDRAVHRLGIRWGRSVPIAVTRLLVGLAYLLCIVSPGALSVVVLMCVVAWATDLGNAPMWAYAQDVGGRYVGAVLGWANMWGNFGAAVAPEFLRSVRNAYPDAPLVGWNAAFLVCAFSQLLAALVALAINANRPISNTGEVPR